MTETSIRPIVEAFYRASAERDVVLAAGINGESPELEGFGYQPPPTGTMCQTELYLGEAEVASRRKYELDGLNREVAVLIGAGNHQGAIPLLRQVVERAPDDPTHYVRLGTSLLKSGQAAEAVQAFETALRRNTADSSVHRYLAEAYLAAGQPDASRAAAARYREAIERAKRQRAVMYGKP